MLSPQAIVQSTFKLSLLFLLALLLVQTSHATEHMVNINRAGVEELAEKLSGIGPTKARAIVLYRELHGPFETVDDLIKVKGIGPRTIEKNRAQLIVTADDRLSQAQKTSVATTTGSVHSRLAKDKQTRHAVRSRIEAAQRDSIARKH